MTLAHTPGRAGTASGPPVPAQIPEPVRAEEAPLVRHWETVRLAVRTAMRTLHERGAAPPDAGADDTALPQLDGPMREFLAASAASVVRLPDYRSARLHLLDLRRHPASRTADTQGALVTVARAVQHIRSTGEPVTLLAPSSGNGATALRDAVLRAQLCGLAGPDQLRAVCLVPARSRDKVGGSTLDEHPELRRRNPLVVYHGSEPAGVRGLARDYHQAHTTWLRVRTGGALWWGAHPADHRAAATVRALLERESLPPAPPRGRVHAQAVATATGLLGHQLGTTLAEPEDGPAPRYFMVQHPRTPGLVLHALTGSFSRDGLPSYTWDRTRRLHQQREDPHFPRTTYAPEEEVDPTFYVRFPDTAAEMTAAVRAGGGGGIVVSRYECLARYPSVRAMLRPAGIELPDDPGRLREWALVMAMTGVLNAVDRGLLESPEVLVHGTGCYSEDELTPLPAAHARYADSAGELHTVVAAAVDPDGRH
ncbi:MULTISPECIES: DUF6002 family protein [unclassified Streptomyces]|uniref:DUF6002 family protein n=1 Tax=unclassified Streptomyces TaxID=2593676 RepID=UPI002DDB31AA|nr:DUF6002 family protein [Streptomyces sp. NBC_01795]WSA95460.1 DUF6002 family protein [Streptomyces sp. NBC_01795]WSS40631.1 DUF6002 family protein [Streptomyces sp. NBC_01187]